MAAWLKECRILTVAMQATAVYWISVYDILEAAGLEVYLVNARDTGADADESPVGQCVERSEVSWKIGLD